MNKKILALALATAFTVGTANATVVIDDFSVDSDFVSAPGTNIDNITSDFSILRTLDIVENPEGPSGADAVVTDGVLAISTGFDTGADTTLEYDNATGFDFTTVETGGGSVFDTFFLTVLSIDQGGVEITLTVDGVSFTHSVGEITSPTDVLFAHSLFGDVSDVNSIDYLIHNNLAVDASFDSFGSFGSESETPPTVPEPTSLALLGLGLVAFGYGRRKAK